MNEQNLSDLARSILNNETILPASASAPSSPKVERAAPLTPKGARPITEGTRVVLSTADDQNLPNGCKTLNFSKDEQ